MSHEQAERLPQHYSVDGTANLDEGAANPVAVRPFTAESRQFALRNLEEAMTALGLHDNDPLQGGTLRQYAPGRTTAMLKVGKKEQVITIPLCDSRNHPYHKSQFEQFLSAELARAARAEMIPPSIKNTL
jgi:hypothetical protein